MDTIFIKIWFCLKICSRYKNEIKNYWICNLSEVVIEGFEVDILEKIKIARSKNEEVVRVVEKIKKVEVKEIRGEK